MNDATPKLPVNFDSLLHLYSVEGECVGAGTLKVPPKRLLLSLTTCPALAKRARRPDLRKNAFNIRSDLGLNVVLAFLPQNELTVAHGTIINQYPQKLWLAENLVALPLTYV